MDAHWRTILLHLRANIALYVIILILPFLMFHWMLPFVSGQTLGNDYQLYSIQEQMELMFSLETGSAPLYLPGYAGGQSASALTLGQMFHPISHIAAHLPGYWNGRALEWNTLFRLLSLGWAHLALFAFFRRLKFDPLTATLLSGVAVYNLRMLDLFRYGASFESWTGHLFLCAAIGCYWLKPTTWRGPILIVAATYWLICSGHPQMMYYGLIGAGLFTLIIPYFTAVMLPDRDAEMGKIRHFWMRTGFCLGMGILLSSAYILPFYFDFIATNAGRVSQSYLWADEIRDTFVGTLNNFFQPLRSDVHGVFGGSSLFLVAAITPVLRLFRVRIPAVIWAIWILIFLMFLHIQGGRTPVHYLVWKYLPFASSFRVAGRISLILPILLTLMLAWVMRSEAFRMKLAGREIHATPQTILAMAALMLSGAYLFSPDLVNSGFTLFSAQIIRKIPPWVGPLSLISGTATLTALLFYPPSSAPSLSWTKLSAKILLCLLVCFQVMLLVGYGTWIKNKREIPTFEKILSDKQKQNASMSGLGMSSETVMRQVRQSATEPFLGKIYGKYLIADSNDAAYTLMEQGRSPDQVIVEEFIPDSSLESPLFETGPDQVKLIYSSLNRLIFNIQASAPGFFGMAYPYSKHWNAYVNGQKVRTYRANGAAHAVRIPPGPSQVEFKYQSVAALWGMIVSCATFGLAGMIISFCALKRPLGLAGAGAALIVGVGGFFLWHQSLYTGRNLNITYAWSSDMPPSPCPAPVLSNIAYGKKTQMSPVIIEVYPHLYNSGLAVDGNRSPASGSVTRLEAEPWWMVDLYHPAPVSAVAIYEGRRGSALNFRPLEIMLSDDGEVWRTAGVITEPKNDRPLCFTLETPQTARYVKIKASGSCHLAIDEVEVMVNGEL